MGKLILKPQWDNTSVVKMYLKLVLIRYNKYRHEIDCMKFILPISRTPSMWWHSGPLGKAEVESQAGEKGRAKSRFFIGVFQGRVNILFGIVKFERFQEVLDYKCDP